MTGRIMLATSRPATEVASARTKLKKRSYATKVVGLKRVKDKR